jgi:hypothetical protein
MEGRKLRWLVTKRGDGMDHFHRFKVNMHSVEAVVNHPDGTKTNRGMLSYWHRNPLKRWLWQVQQFLKRRG